MKKAFEHFEGTNEAPLEASYRDPQAVLSALTVSLVPTYKRCRPETEVLPPPAPRRVLTKPSDPVSPGSADNVNHDLIVAVGDVFTSSLGTRYMVRDVLGQGTFGQVFKCTNLETGESVAVKVIKNQAAYYHQARVEIGVLQFLNAKADPRDRHHIVRLKDFFLHSSHLCLVFELLSLNLYELVRHNRFRGLSLALVRVFVSQMLVSLVVLHKSSIIHCDIKPENILLTAGAGSGSGASATGEVKLIDFGSACFSNRTVYSYVQSRFYRSPEVVLGVSYGAAVDVWSLGCVAAELFLGLPLLPAACELDLLTRIIDTIGPLPSRIVEQGKKSHKFFVRDGDGDDAPANDRVDNGVGKKGVFRLRTPAEFTAATGEEAPIGKQYFHHKALADIINAYPMRSGLSDEEIMRERLLRESFTDFLFGLLDVDPASRWTPRQAQGHPFITGEPFTGPYQPAADPTPISIDTKSQRPSIPWPCGSAPTLPVAAAVATSPGSIPGAPMSIPESQSRPKPAPVPVTSKTSGSAAAAAAQGAAAGGSGSLLDQMAAALLATSPQIHAQAHAAAMAAVQMQMNLAAQQKQKHGGGGSGTAMATPAAAVPTAIATGTAAESAMLGTSYTAAHSLQRILTMPTQSPQLSQQQQQQASTSVPPWSGPGSLGASQPSSFLFSPPSRSFGIHLAQQALNAAPEMPPPSFDPRRPDAHRIMPLLHLPGSSERATSGASDWNHHHHHQQQQQQLDQNPALTFQPSSVSTYLSTMAQAAMAAAAEGREDRSLDADGGIEIGLEARRWSSGVEGDESGRETAAGVRSAGATPLQETEAGTPNPADWDPLWSDDLLKEEDAEDSAAAAELSSHQEVSRPGRPAPLPPFSAPRAATAPLDTSPAEFEPTPPRQSLDLGLAAASRHLDHFQRLDPGSSSKNGGVHGIATAATHFVSADPIDATSGEMSLGTQDTTALDEMLWSPPRGGLLSMMTSHGGGGTTATDRPPTKQQQQQVQQQKIHGFDVPSSSD